VVFLPGWGSASRVFAPLLARITGWAELLAEELPLPADTLDGIHSLEAALAVLAERLPPRAVLVGWSLGGALATLFAVRHPERVAALVCIASSPCFCAREDWPLGMPGADFDAFVAGFNADPEAQLARFVALQSMGDRDARTVSQALLAARTNAGKATLQRGLEWLETLDLRGVSLGPLPVLRIFGARDRLVPAALATPDVGEATWVLPEAAHAPFLSHPDAVAARILDFLLGELAPPALSRDKRDVARSFGRAASGYDAAAALQRDCGEQLLGLLPRAAHPARVLDLGCGTGAFLPALEAAFPGARLLAADLAEGMLAAARRGEIRCAWVGADAERLPLADRSIDIVFSNLALQWCEDVEGLWREIARVLTPGGQAVVSTLGPATLWELRAAWRSVDVRVHVNRFVPPARLCAAILAAGLDVEHCVRDERRLRYGDVRELARGLQQIGARNLNAERPLGLAGRRQWSALAEAYAAIDGGSGGIHATWELLRLVVVRAE
jgi:malonyl-CoA O-methyltransferase